MYTPRAYYSEYSSRIHSPSSTAPPPPSSGRRGEKNEQIIKIAFAAMMYLAGQFTRKVYPRLSLFFKASGFFAALILIYERFSASAGGASGNDAGSNGVRGMRGSYTHWDDNHSANHDRYQWNRSSQTPSGFRTNAAANPCGNIWQAGAFGAASAQSPAISTSSARTTETYAGSSAPLFPVARETERAEELQSGFRTNAAENPLSGFGTVDPFGLGAPFPEFVGRSRDESSGRTATTFAGSDAQLFSVGSS